MPRVCLQFVIVVFPDHTHLLFLALTLEYNILLSCCQCHVQDDLDVRQKSRYCFVSASKKYISLEIVLISVCQKIRVLYFHSFPF